MSWQPGIKWCLLHFRDRDSGDGFSRANPVGSGSFRSARTALQSIAAEPEFSCLEFRSKKKSTRETVSHFLGFSHHLMLNKCRHAHFPFVHPLFLSFLLVLPIFFMVTFYYFCNLGYSFTGPYFWFLGFLYVMAGTFWTSGNCFSWMWCIMLFEWHIILKSLVFFRKHNYLNLEKNGGFFCWGIKCSSKSEILLQIRKDVSKGSLCSRRKWAPMSPLGTS
jgi:hypothetical protein